MGQKLFNYISGQCDTLTAATSLCCSRSTRPPIPNATNNSSGDKTSGRESLSNRTPSSQTEEHHETDDRREPQQDQED